MQRLQHLAFMQEQDKSYLRVVPSVQFSPPSTGGVNNLVGVCHFKINGDDFYLFNFVINATDDRRSYLHKYDTSGGAFNGVIESSSKLTFVANLGSVNQTVSGSVRRPEGATYVKIGGVDYIYYICQDGYVLVYEITIDLNAVPAVASLTFVSGYSVFGSSQQWTHFWFNDTGTKVWCGDNGGTRMQERTLTVPFDFGSSHSQTELNTNHLLASVPYFFSGGRYCLGLYRYSDSSSNTVWDLCVYELAEVYNPMNFTVRYRRPILNGLTNSKLRIHQFLPLFLSYDQKKLNWFASGRNSANANGNIGIGTFDLTRNFRGDSNTAQSGVRGIAFTDGTYVEVPT